MPMEMNGVQAWITVDNKVQLTEYEVDLDLSSSTAMCWIPGEPGQVCFIFSFSFYTGIHIVRPLLTLERRGPAPCAIYLMIRIDFLLFHKLTVSLRPLPLRLLQFAGESLKIAQISVDSL